MTVYLVGAGPGDPGLLTVRGAELLAGADVVVHDRLSALELLDLAPQTAERIDVGKNPAGPSTPQSDINDLLVALGRTDRSVVRLKGGDPFVFARGAEEAAVLEAAGVDYEVVPGITSAVAVPAYAGIPVTLRYSSTSVTIVTGHEDPTKGRTDVGWEALAGVGGTIVVLMGVKHLPQIAARLMAGGLSPDTPAAAVRWGTRSEQHTVRATLSTLADHDLQAPSTIVIGEVAAQQLGWFERRPLLGRSVVVTRAVEQSPELSRQLRAAGADVVVAPTIAIADPADGGAALRDAVARIGDYDWVVLSSPNGAERFAAELSDGRDLAGVKVAVIGPGTASVMGDVRITADLIPPHFVAESLLEVFPDPPAGGGRVLFARAEVARDVLSDGLVAKGWSVDVVDAYRTVRVDYDDDTRRRVSAADAVTFTSSSSVRHFVQAMGGSVSADGVSPDGGVADGGVAGVPSVVACIGPVTAGTARELGLEVAAQAEPHSIDGLVKSVVDALAAGPS